MQCPTFNPIARTHAWDRYKAFYINHHTRAGVEIVQFDTGEMLVRVHGARPDPEGRTYHPTMGIRIATTANDDGCPQMQLRDGTPVPAAWYAGGGHAQTLLIDDDTGVVVGLGGGYTIPYEPKYGHRRNQSHVDYAISNGIPSRFADLSGGLVWFAGNGRIPVSNRPIALYPPITHPPESWQRARAYRAAARAWMALEGMAMSPDAWNRPVPRDVLDVLAYPTFGDMPPMVRTNLALGGLTSGTTHQLVSSLRVAPPEGRTTVPRTMSAAEEDRDRKESIIMCEEDEA